MSLRYTLLASLLKCLPIAIAKKSTHKLTSKYINDSNDVKKNIYVDVSILIQHDSKTGIQRVVKEVLNQLTQTSDTSLTIIPVAATKKKKYHKVAMELNGIKISNSAEESQIKLGNGDVFLGLDLATYILPSHWSQLLEWKLSGVSIQIVVYDLLPVLHPEWFKNISVQNFKRWLKTIAVFTDKFHCISHTVKFDLTHWFNDSYNINLNNNILNVFPLGSNFKTQSSNTLANQLDNEALAFCRRSPTVLMVGTIEPRKGHIEVLNAFKMLWHQSSEYQLIIVGSLGWKAQSIQKQLQDISATNNKLLWLHATNDNLLEDVYKSVIGVIVASEGEGFGLPIIEAAHFNKPILARDIPIFREVAQGNVTYFISTPEQRLSVNAVNDWLTTISTNQSTKSLCITDWETSTSVLLANIKNNVRIN